MKALEDAGEVLANDGEGSLYRTLFTPAEGETHEEIGKKAAKALWAVAQPAAEALRS